MGYAILKYFKTKEEAKEYLNSLIFIAELDYYIFKEPNGEWTVNIE